MDQQPTISPVETVREALSDILSWAVDPDQSTYADDRAMAAEVALDTLEDQVASVTQELDRANSQLGSRIIEVASLERQIEVLTRSNINKERFLANAEAAAARWKRAWHAEDAMDMATRLLSSSDDEYDFFHDQGAHFLTEYKEATADLVRHGELEDHTRFDLEDL